MKKCTMIILLLSFLLSGMNMALSQSQLWAWGANYNGQLGIGDSWSPQQTVDGEDWHMVSAVWYHTVALKSDGTLWTWGANNSGQLGDGTKISRNNPVQVGEDNDWNMVSAGYTHTIALKSDGTLWAWGANNSGQLGDGTTYDRYNPVQIGEDEDWQMISPGGAHTVALKSDGTLWAWGANYSGQLGDGTTDDRYNPVQVGEDNDWNMVSTGYRLTIALKSDGTLWAWGDNNFGQLGDGTTDDRYNPVQIGEDDDWNMVSAGWHHTVALKSDGTLWTWGDNYYGQLGNGTNISRNNPVQVGEDEDWDIVAAGYEHTIALKSDGTLWEWGYNYWGQLGDGTNISRYNPVQIGEDDDWHMVSAGRHHTIALKSDGTLWAWGANYYGQLGNENFYSRNRPVQVGEDEDWNRISAGNEHTIALKSDGTLWAWGHRGQLGDSTTDDRYSPVQVGEDEDWDKVAAGKFHNLALKSDGTLWAWGANYKGQLGDGTTDYRYSPVQVGEDYNWNVVSAGDTYTNALKSDGTLWTWGGMYYEFSDNTFHYRTRPTQIGGAANWITVSTGTEHSIALKGTWFYAPSLVLPANKAEYIPISTEFSWLSVENATSYTLQLSTDVGFDNLIVFEEGIDSTDFGVAGLDYKTEYFWRVKAVNDDDESNWSEVWSFKTKPEINSPYLISPEDSTMNLPIDVNFEWQEEDIAISYTLQLSTDVGFDSLVVFVVEIEATEFEATGLDYETEYFWRVKAVNDDDESDWSEVWSFKTKPEINSPFLISPENNTTNLPIDVNFVWQEVSNATIYTLQLATNDAFFNPIFVKEGIEQTEFTVTGLDYETEYFWRVKARNNSAGSYWSKGWSFKTKPEKILLPAPQLLLPSKGSVVQTYNVTFQWHEVSKATLYTLQVSTDENFQNIIIHKIGITGTRTFGYGLKNNTKYYWRVTGYNTLNLGRWSEIWSFTKGTDLSVNNINNKNNYLVSYDDNDLTITDNSQQLYNEPVRVYLYNQLGQLVSESRMGNKTVVIDISNLSTGVYILNIINDNQIIYTYKLLK